MPNPSPLGLLLAAVKALVETVRTANDYRTELGADVATERYQTPATDAPRAVVGWQSFEQASTANKCRTRDVVLAIEVTVSATSANAAANCSAAIDDLVDLIPAIKTLTLAAKITVDLIPGPARQLDRLEGVDVVVGQMLFNAKLRERLA